MLEQADDGEANDRNEGITHALMLRDNKMPFPDGLLVVSHAI